MRVDQSSQNSVLKNRGEKNSSMRRLSSDASGVSVPEVPEVPRGQAVPRAVLNAAVAVDDVHAIMKLIARVQG
jgi:hypothetical protein